MGRKKLAEKRVQLNRHVAQATPPLVKSLSEGWGVSEGVAIDRAIQLAAIAESFGPEVIKKSSVIKTVDKVADDVQSGDPVQIVTQTVAVKAKFVPPANPFRRPRRER